MLTLGTENFVFFLPLFSIFRQQTSLFGNETFMTLRENVKVIQEFMGAEILKLMLV